MAGPTPSLKDTVNYQMVSGLDENDEAQEIRFHGDNVLVVTRLGDLNNEPISDIYIKQEVIGEVLTDILNQLKIMNTHLSILTENEITIEEIE
jgi:endonuclease/exonuclease/phosphatase family metal-dependent hydrolase